MRAEKPATSRQLLPVMALGLCQGNDKHAYKRRPWGVTVTSSAATRVWCASSLEKGAESSAQGGMTSTQQKATTSLSSSLTYQCLWEAVLARSLGLLYQWR